MSVQERYFEVKSILEQFANQCYSESGSYAGCAGSYEALLTLLIIGEITPERALKSIQSQIEFKEQA